MTESDKFEDKHFESTGFADRTADAKASGDTSSHHDASAAHEAQDHIYESRRIPPHGDVAPDGKRIWPQPSPTAKWLVWGGVGIAAAAVTAGSVLAGRRIAEMLRDDDEEKIAEPIRRAGASARARMASVAPRFAEMGEKARAEMRDRNRQRELEDALAAAHQRAEAAERALMKSRKRVSARGRGLLEEAETNVRRLGGSAESTIGALGAAVSGFRTVAGQAGNIVSEFQNAAQMIRGLLAQGAEKAREKAEDLRDSVRDAPSAEDVATKAAEEADRIARRSHRL